MNICRYITGNETLFLSRIMIWNSIVASPPPYGALIIIDAPEWCIELSYPSDLRRKRSHEIYVTGYSQGDFSYTSFTLYYITNPNMRKLKVVL